MRFKKNAQNFEKIFHLLALSVSKPLCFHDLNVIIKIKTAAVMKIFPLVRNRNFENSKNPKITPSAKIFIEGIHKTYFEYKYINYINLSERHQT